MHRYLNIGGMFHWQQIHWLKLLSTMAATLREVIQLISLYLSVCNNFGVFAYIFKDLKSSLTLICELLTENEPGDVASIPFWMFRECYVFLAQIDCSTDCNITSDSSVVPDPKPLEINAVHFRRMMLIEWRNYAREETSGSHFHEIFSCIARANRFDEIITVLGKYEKDANTPDEKIDTIDPKLYAEIVREMGASWMWIDQFVSLHSPHLKSYNYRECYHTDTMALCLSEVEPKKSILTEYKGIGASVEPQIIEKFLIYFESQATHEMIDPTQLENIDCPPLA